MQKPRSQNENVDQLAKRLISKTMLTETEIERIVASPLLYSSIRNRVNSTPASKATFAWFRIPTVAAFASLLVVAGFTGSVFLRSGEPTQTASGTQPKAGLPGTIKKVNVPDGLVTELKDPEVTVIKPQHEGTRMQYQNASDRKTAPRSIRPPQPRIEKQPDLEFIPLVYTDDPAESVRGGRVIRVEMSRASLFAMGINIPIANGAEMIKADLLVGQDGVPRGIRVPQ